MQSASQAGTVEKGFMMVLVHCCHIVCTSSHIWTAVNAGKSLGRWQWPHQLTQTKAPFYHSLLALRPMAVMRSINGNLQPHACSQSCTAKACSVLHRTERSEKCSMLLKLRNPVTGPLAHTQKPTCKKCAAALRQLNLAGPAHWWYNQDANQRRALWGSPWKHQGNLLLYMCSRSAAAVCASVECLDWQSHHKSYKSSASCPPYKEIWSLPYIGLPITKPRSLWPTYCC